MDIFKKLFDEKDDIGTSRNIINNNWINPYLNSKSFIPDIDADIYCRNELKPEPTEEEIIMGELAGTNDWNEISLNYKLSENFIRTYKDKLDLFKIVLHSELSASFKKEIFDETYGKLYFRNLFKDNYKKIYLDIMNFDEDEDE